VVVLVDRIFLGNIIVPTTIAKNDGE